MTAYSRHTVLFVYVKFFYLALKKGYTYIGLCEFYGPNFLHYSIPNFSKCFSQFYSIYATPSIIIPCMCII